jgi:hypothetical protein
MQIFTLSKDTVGADISAQIIIQDSTREVYAYATATGYILPVDTWVHIQVYTNYTTGEFHFLADGVRYPSSGEYAMGGTVVPNIMTFGVQNSDGDNYMYIDDLDWGDGGGGGGTDKHPVLRRPQYATALNRPPLGERYV